MKTVPANVSRYAATPEFTDATVPQHLLDSHETKPGVWAKIVVLEGSLLYRILGPEVEEYELSPERPGVAEPEVPHRVEITGPVRFQLELYR